MTSYQKIILCVLHAFHVLRKYYEVLNLPHCALIDITDSNGIAYMCAMGNIFKTPILLLLKETSNCFYFKFEIRLL